MSAPSATKVKVAGTGAIWKAPLGTALPTDSITSWNAAFVNLGFMDDGFSVEQALVVKDVKGWQSLETLRAIATDLIRKFMFDSIQTDKETLALAWGGGTITPVLGTSVGTVTIAITTGLITTSAAHGLAVGNTFQLQGVVNGTPFVSNQTYYVQAVGSSTTLYASLTPGGAVITTTAAGTATGLTALSGGYSMAIPDAKNLLDFILGIDISDGTTSMRFIIQRAHQTKLPTIKYGRQDKIAYAIEVEALATLDGTNSVLIYGFDPSIGGY